MVLVGECRSLLSKLTVFNHLSHNQDVHYVRFILIGDRADQGEFRILYYIQEATAEQLGQVQIFRVGKRNDDEVYRNL